MGPKGTQDEKAQETGPREINWVSKNHFSKPRLLHLPIQRKALNSLTWGVFCPVAKSCPTLGNLMDCSRPGSPVLHHLLKFAHFMSTELVMPSYHLILCLPLLLLPSIFQHQGLILWVSSSHQVAKVLELQLQHQSFQQIFRVDFLCDWLVLISLLSKGLSRVFSRIAVQKHQFFGARPSL